MDFVYSIKLEINSFFELKSSFNKAQKEMRNRYPYDPKKRAGFVYVR